VFAFRWSERCSLFLATLRRYQEEISRRPCTGYDCFDMRAPAEAA
jgi:hypothetical protein